MTQLELDFGPPWTPPTYRPDAPPGTFQHAGGDCPRHGVNVCFFGLYKDSGPKYCVACALEVLT